MIEVQYSLHSLSLRVISTAKTVTEMLSLLDRMSFRTAAFNSLWNSPRNADVNPDQKNVNIRGHIKQRAIFTRPSEHLPLGAGT